MDLKCNSILLRMVEESDAEFILSLRSDSRYNAHLSTVSSSLQDQVDWICRYKIDEIERRQFYFIIERIDGVRCGTVRIYDLTEESFCWGSWILNEEKTKYAALESAFLVYKYGFTNLGFYKSHFDVRRENHKVISFHERMGAISVREDVENIYFEITRSAVEVAMRRLGYDLF